MDGGVIMSVSGGLWRNTMDCAIRTPEVMNHVEVADLWEKPSHGFSVVLAVSDGPGPAHTQAQPQSQRGPKAHTAGFIWRNNSGEKACTHRIFDRASNGDFDIVSEVTPACF